MSFLFFWGLFSNDWPLDALFGSRLRIFRRWFVVRLMKCLDHRLVLQGEKFKKMALTTYKHIFFALPCIIGLCISFPFDQVLAISLKVWARLQKGSVSTFFVSLKSMIFSTTNTFSSSPEDSLRSSIRAILSLLFVRFRQCLVRNLIFLTKYIVYC